MTAGQLNPQLVYENRAIRPSFFRAAAPRPRRRVVASRSTPSIEFPRAGTPAGTPKDAGSECGTISGPGLQAPALQGPIQPGPAVTVTRQHRRATFRPDVRPSRCSCEARGHRADCHRGRSSSGGACNFERAQQGAGRAAGTRGNGFHPAGAQSAGERIFARRRAIRRWLRTRRESPPRSGRELPASDSNSGPRPPDQSGQIVADGIQPETSTADYGNTTGNTTDNTAGNSQRNRPPPLSPPPVSSEQGEMRWRLSKQDNPDE